jgi:thiamine biosynthesis lipoprotein
VSRSPSEVGGRVTRREALRITALTGVTVALGGGGVAAVLRHLGLHRVSETRSLMGTIVTLTAIHPEAAEAGRMIGAGFAEMVRLESLLSRHRPDTPVGKLNAEGSLQRPPSELLAVLAHAGSVSRASDGAFDATVLPLVRLWESSFATTGRPPSDDAIDATRRRVDYRGLDVREDRIAFAQPGMALSLDGIAKGFVVDRAIETLVARGADRVLVDAGGDMATAGDGSIREPWSVGIEDPHRPGGVVDVVRLAGACVATSGDYQQSFTQDRRYHHIIDPRTGRSPEALSSASVVAPSAMQADALSTAVMVLGPDAGAALLDSTPGVSGVIVDKLGRRTRT